MGRWREQIEELSRADARGALFGVPSHRFKRRLPTVEAVCAFEEWFGVSLPEGYRDYLLEVGFGVGPYHGLLTFERIKEELQCIYASYQEEFSVYHLPADDFGLESTVAAALQDGKPLKFEAPDTSGGFIPICEMGCEFLTVLVTTGKFRGRVFDTTDFAMCRSVWSGAESPPGIVKKGVGSAPDDQMPPLPTFSEWAEAWMRSCIRDLKMA